MKYNSLKSHNMSKINLHLYLCLLLILDYFRNGATLNYNPYDNQQQHHLLHTTNAANDGHNNAQRPAFTENAVYQTNLQGDSNYQQLYRYYYNPPYQQQQQQWQQQQQQQPWPPQQSTQLWSGPPIVVEEDMLQQQPQSTTDIPTTFYQQHSTGSINQSSSTSSSELLPFLPRHSKVLTAATYSPQPTVRTTQAYFTSNNNPNNNNIIYHRDFRHEIYAIPDAQSTRQEGNPVSWNNQQQENLRLLKRQQQQKLPQQSYSSDTNLNYNGISNELLAASLMRKADVPDYREHFKRYLANNPRRIKPIY